MIFSSAKQDRLHTCTNIKNKKYPHTTSDISDKTHSHSLPKSNFIEPNKPLLCFTSFQHYLEDCNQNEFHKRQSEKFYRSVNKAKTQEYFTYKREKSNSSESKRKTIRIFTVEDSVIQPFNQQDQQSIKQRNYHRSNRNITSKSSSDNYLLDNSSRAEVIFNEKFGTIEGWNSDQKGEKNERVFQSSKSILQERKLNSIKNRLLKTSQNSFKKDQSQKSITQIHPNNEQKKVLKSNKNSNKENIQYQKLISSQSPKQQQSQQQLFYPIEISHKQKTKQNLLTSINQLEEQIILSKRQQNFPGSFSSRNNNCHDQTFHYQENVLQQQNSNIRMLKKEFQYLCKDDFEVQETEESSHSMAQPHMSVKSVKNELKYFKRFPNYENKQNSTCYYPFDSVNFDKRTNRPKTTQDLNPSSPSMLKILHSITQNPNEKYLYEVKTPLKKNKKIPQSDVNTPHNIKNISNQKENFQSSIKNRKSHSAFYQTNEFGRVCNDSNKKEQDSLRITVFSSFKSCKSKKDSEFKWNTKYHSLQKNIKNRLSTEEKNPSINDQENFEDICLNKQQFLSEAIDISQQKTSHQNNILTNDNKSLQKLNQLSQQLKNCTKIPGSAKYVSLMNKKFIYLNKAGRIKQREQIQSITKNKQKNIIKNLTITQLEGRHIEKLRKKFDLNNQ